MRQQYDVQRRSLWKDSECGNIHVRSMAPEALLNAIEGFRVENVESSNNFTRHRQRGLFPLLLALKCWLGTVMNADRCK